MTEVIHWIPRVLAFGMAAFCYLFTLEVFSEGWQAALSHFAQGTVLLILALVSWRWPIPGGSIYIGLGLYFLLKWRRRINASTIRLLSVPIATGLLFIIFGIFL